jgi:hypothetical protein
LGAIHSRTPTKKIKACTWSTDIVCVLHNNFTELNSKNTGLHGGGGGGGGGGFNLKTEQNSREKDCASGATEKEQKNTPNLDSVLQGCGSVSGLDPDSMTLWIRIRSRVGIRIPDPDPGARKWRKISTFLADFIYFYNGKV